MMILIEKTQKIGERKTKSFLGQKELIPQKPLEQGPIRPNPISQPVPTVWTQIFHAILLPGAVQPLPFRLIFCL